MSLGVNLDSWIRKKYDEIQKLFKPFKHKRQDPISKALFNCIMRLNKRFNAWHGSFKTINRKITNINQTLTFVSHRYGKI